MTFFSLNCFLVSCFLVSCFLWSCSEPRPFDSAEYLRSQVRTELGPTVDGAALADDLAIPFELSAESIEAIDGRIRTAGDARARVSSVLDFIFRGLDLRYRLEPTRDANGTLSSREGNCLSFVNLFVAVGRHLRLDPFYVEVEDYQRWDHRKGLVVSQGHIVAGLYIQGRLRTYDFLPYRVKSYKSFSPIDDRTATAHYFNNLGAEALLEGDIETSRGHLETAIRVDPSFTKAINNLGVWHARNGDPGRAVEIYRGGLENAPDDVPLLTNLARAHQLSGNEEEAAAVLARIEDFEHQNPFFYAYLGEAALARGDTREALEALRDALRIDTEIPEVHVGLAKVYTALGEVKKAGHHLGRALELDPHHPEALRQRALLGPSSPAPDPTSTDDPSP